MTDAERDAAIARLRNFAEQQQQSAATQEEGLRTADQSSMKRAADLIALYEDGKWQEEVETPKRRPGRRGAKVDSFNQFAKWAESTSNLKRTHLNQLRKAHELAEQISAMAEKYPESERAVRPLHWMVKNKYADRIGEVWAAAVKRAGGEQPTNKDVAAALADWKRENIKAPEVAQKKASNRRGARERAVDDVDDLVKLYSENPSDVGPLIDQLYEKIQAQRAQVPDTVEELLAS